MIAIKSRRAHTQSCFMTDYIVNAKITVSGGDDDRAKIQDAVDAGLKELNGIASRYGFTITDSSANVEAAS
jgi:hypothetical protein